MTLEAQLFVADMAAAVDFYTKQLGFEVGFLFSSENLILRNPRTAACALTLNKPRTTDSPSAMNAAGSLTRFLPRTAACALITARSFAIRPN